jgi:hypothetical protein
VQALVELVKDDYDIAAEHAHSRSSLPLYPPSFSPPPSLAMLTRFPGCCVLAAHKDFFVDGAWQTWIDYDRFFELVEKGQPFTAKDYMAPLPTWGEFGSAEAGFSPEDVSALSLSLSVLLFSSFLSGTNVLRQRKEEQSC